MSFHKLLKKQIGKFLTEEILQHPEIEKFLNAVNSSYIACDRDAALADRAFSISEEEYIEINNKLKYEVALKRQSIEKLKEAIGTITGNEKRDNSDDLLVIAKTLNEQVNKRKKAEADLKKSQELWQFALEGAGDGVWEYDFETDDVFFSRQYKQMLGYNDDEFKNDIDEWLCRIHPDDMGIIKNTDRDYFDKNISSHQQEYRIKHKNGTYLYILDRGKVINYTTEGKPKRIIGTHTDITAQKESENEYKRISVVASANENGVVFTDAEGKIFWSNEGFSTITGYTKDEITGKTPLELCEGPLSKSDALQNMIDAFFEGRSFNVELINYRKNGTWFWARVTGQAIVSNQGEVEQYFAIIENISAEKEVQRKLKLYDERLKLALASGRDNY